MKKKISLLSALFLFGLASIASAEATFDSTGTTTTVTGVINQFRSSKNVEIAVNASVAAYGAVSDHQNGNRAYATISDDPLLYFQDKTDAEIGTNVAATKATASDATQISGWESL